MSAIPGILNGGAQQIGPATNGTRGQNVQIDGQGGLIYGSETLGTRLRRQYARAAKSNPYTLPYLIKCPAWQPSTTYNKGTVVVNGGNLFTSYSAGTSAASGNGPTSTIASGAADGTTGWIYIGPNSVTIDPSTVSYSAWAASTAYGAGSFISDNNGVFVAIYAGTSNSTQPTWTTGVGITDNTVTWNYYGPLQNCPFIADFPTWTTSGSAPALTNIYLGTSINVNTPMTVKNAWPVNGGTGYAVNDTITIGSGTFSTATIIRVSTVSSGVITGVSIMTAGSYTAIQNTVTVTQSATSGSGTGATFDLDWGDLYWCKGRGCYFSGCNAGSIRMFNYHPTLDSIPAGQYAALEWWSDAPVITFRQKSSASSQSYNLIVDNRRIRIDGMQPGAADVYTTLTWSGGRKQRLYRLEWRNGTPNLFAVYVDSNSTCWKADDSDKTRVVVISDSLFAGSAFGPFVPGGSCSQLLGHYLGWNDVWDFTQGGTGYVNRGGGPGATTDNFGFRVPEAIMRTPDLWVLMGSTNDQNNYSSYQASLTAAITAIRAGSKSPIVVLGIWSLNDSAWTSGQQIANFEALAASAVSAMNDPLIFFVPIRNDISGPWITGSWNNSYNTNSTNSVAYVSSDNTHPSDFGTQYEARRIVTAIANQVLPLIP